MAKLNIIVADSDEEYMEALERYFRTYYRERIESLCITSQEYLIEYMKKEITNIDILLVTPRFLHKLNLDKVNTVVLLTDGRIPQEYIKFESIAKYQEAQKLVRRIIDIYAENNPDEVYTSFNDRKTKVIGVFSPDGGAGKTTISIAISLRSSQRGMNVFYLNIENIPSTQVFLDCNSENNLSDVLYYLKEKSKNLSLKIEGARLEDLASGIHFFAPPDSPLEMNEILDNDISELVSQLKSLNRYDSIVIDMSSVINEKNLKLFEICDSIICISTPDKISQKKASQFIKALEMTERVELKTLQVKLKFVVNKYDASCVDMLENLYGEGKVTAAKIPNRPEIYFDTGERLEISLDNDFGESINLLVSSIFGENEYGS